MLEIATREPVALSSVDITQVEVPHLYPRVLVYELSEGAVKILVRFSSHCWTESFDRAKHLAHCAFMDNKRERAFDPERMHQSRNLVSFLEKIQSHRCVLMKNERNYMAYNAALDLGGGMFYRVFFRVEKVAGRFDGVRHSLTLTVESAYVSSNIIDGMSVRFDAIVSSVLRDKKIFYKP